MKTKMTEAEQRAAIEQRFDGKTLTTITAEIKALAYNPLYELAQALGSKGRTSKAKLEDKVLGIVQGFYTNRGYLRKPGKAEQEPAELESKPKPAKRARKAQAVSEAAQ